MSNTKIIRVGKCYIRKKNCTLILHITCVSLTSRSKCLDRTNQNWVLICHILHSGTKHLYQIFIEWTFLSCKYFTWLKIFWICPNNDWSDCLQCVKTIIRPKWSQDCTFDLCNKNQMVWQRYLNGIRSF